MVDSEHQQALWLVKGTIKEIKTADNFCPVINQFIKCSDGYYYAMADEGLFRFENNRFVKIPFQGLTSGAHRFLGMGVEMDGKLFMLYDKTIVTPSTGGMLVYDLLTKKTLAYQDSVYCYFIVRTPWNELWVSTINGMYQLDKNKLITGRISFSRLPGQYRQLTTLRPNSMYVDRQKNIWLSTLTEIFKISAGDGITQYTKEKGLPNILVTSIFQDRENNMWFTTKQDGFMKLSGALLVYYPELKPGFITTDIYVVPGTDSTWFFDGLKNRALLYTENGLIREYVINGIGAFSSMMVAGQKKYVFSGMEIYNWDPGKTGSNVTRIYSSPPDLGFASAVMDSTGNLVAVSKDLIVITGKKIISRPLGELSDQVTIDNKNRIWVSTRTRGFSCFRLELTAMDTSLHLLKSFRGELPELDPRSITSDASGNIWIGTRANGLFCFSLEGLTLKSWKQVTTRNGLSENFVNYLYCDPDNTIWACTPGGLDKVVLRDGKIIVENVTTANNMLHSIYKIQGTRKGIHWVLTDKGIIKIGKQETLRNPVNPVLLFTGISIGNDQYPYSVDKLSLDHKKNNLSFHIAAPSFVNENQTRFTYLLEGSGNTNWSDSTSNMEINFANLPPGDYTLKARAIFLNGLYPDAGSSFSFVIHPPWWQTWWFRSLVGLLIIGLLIIAFRFYYSRKLEKQKAILEKQQAIEKERTRIATDMHDDLGAGLSRIKFLSETIGIKKQQQEPIEEDINKIREYSHEMIDKMGEIVWALNEKNDTLSDLLSYTRAYTMEYLSQNGIECKTEMPDNFPSVFVSGEFRRNVFLTIKEALHNVVKHSQATEVKLTISINHHLSIKLKDNGTGFDKNNIRLFSNGLTNMKSRVNEIGGEIEITNKEGTLIKMVIPLNT